MTLAVRRDRLPYYTRIQTEELFPASQLLTELITFGPQPNKALVGANAFAHEAGIHQDGYLKEKSTYEIIDPRSVGIPEGRLVLGKHSGRHALRSKCEHLGFDLSKDELDAVYHGFIETADRKKGVTDQEILILIHTLKAGERMKADGAAAD
jgi:2-isopropylmalate synthase